MKNWNKRVLPGVYKSSRPDIRLMGMCGNVSMQESIEPLVPALRRYARALLRDRDEADDLVQDCLERVVRNWYQLKEKDKFRAWAFTILHNLSMTRLQRRTRHPPALPIEMEDDFVIPPSQEDTLYIQDIIKALSQLPDDHKTLLLLVAVEDFSYTEAAKILDIPIGTVMSRLSRAAALFFIRPPRTILWEAQ